MQTSTNPEVLLDTVLSAVGSGDDYRSLLDELPVPIYTTDAGGSVTYWNRACIEFAGREPRTGDAWCVTWQLFTTDGEPMPHDECPMARAIQQKRSIRGEIAIAKRPDGSRVAFIPYPTPLFAEDGSLTGAINMLIDISEEQAGELHAQADRCRRLSRATHDQGAAQVLRQMASGYDETAASLRGDRSD